MSSLPQLPERAADGHKGTFGKVLVIGGSRGMSGSVALSGMAALRSGSGLVYVAVPDEILPTVAAFEPSYLTVPVSSDRHGQIVVSALQTIESKLTQVDAVAIGPGAGRSEDLDKIISHLYQTADLPMVVDADALNSLSDQKSVLGEHAGPRILTPHPGEFARLIDSDISHVQKHREELAKDFAEKYGVVLVLKGAGTVVTDGATTSVNETGNSGMATGGTGDVLTGVIASLVGTRMSPWDAARLGVYIHGLAGDLAASELSEQSMIASDLIRFLSQAWKSMSS